MPPFLAGISLKLLGYVAIAGAVLAVLLGARQSGRNAERVERLQKEMENAKQGREIEDRVRDGDLSPDERERLLNRRD